MLNFLRGTVVGLHKTSNRIILILDVNHIGYEIQIIPRLQIQLSSLLGTDHLYQIYTHLASRDDHWMLFGFGLAAERDLFRQLISVSGVGSQSAMALLDALEFPELVQAIVSGNTRLLSKAPGVGNKTAERLSLELRNQLSLWREQSGLVTAPSSTPASMIQEDVEMTLLALGYTSKEILQALQSIGTTPTLSKNADAEAWIREAIAWLSH